MAADPLNKVIQHVRGILQRQEAADMPDRDLVQRYVHQSDDAAFEALVRRHGPMVLGVCRRVLRHRQDAEDAFQATFLVLVRKAATLRSPGRVGPWLHGVAHRTALEAKKAASKRQAKEAMAVPQPQTADDTPTDLGLVLDQELARLPGKYRFAVVLCDLEGMTRKEAARHLGWPEGTVASRLARARTLLAKRLAQHGVALSAGSLAAVLSQHAVSACVPTGLLVSTLKAATLFAAGQAAAAGVISAQVATLTEGVLKAMFLSKLKIATGLLLVVGLAGAGAGMVFQRTQAARPEGPAAQPQAADPPKEEKLRQRVQLLEGENQRLHQELRDLRDKVAALEGRLAPAQKADQQLLYRGKPASYWIKALRDRDPTYRMEALKALGSIGQEDPSVIAVIARSLKDRDGGVQEAAMIALGGIGKDAVPVLIASLKDKNATVRYTALGALYCMGTEARAAVPALVGSLKDQDVTVRQRAAQGLIRFGPEARAAIPALIEALSDKEERVSGAASDTLLHLESLAVPALIEALKNKAAVVRAKAASVLGNIGTQAKPAIPALFGALKDKAVRAEAMEALKGIGSTPDLVKALKDKDPAVRTAAATVLGRMGPIADAAIPALIEALKDENEDVRKAAAKAYRAVDPQGAKSKDP